MCIKHGGGTANLDSYPEGPDIVVGVESKLTEHLVAHAPETWKMPYRSANMAELLGGDAEDIAVSRLNRGIAPARRAEPALGLPDAVLGEEVVGIRALEGDDLQSRPGVDRLDQVEDLVVHQIIDGVDRRVIEGDPPISGHLLVDGEPGRRLVHRYALARRRGRDARAVMGHAAAATGSRAGHPC
jgi:hypothetical protein